MKKIFSILIILFLLSANYNKIYAAGLFLTNGYTQVAPAGFRAAILFDGKTESIIESTTFNLNPLVVWNFLWLIPVPSKPDIEIISDDFFNKIDYLTQKKFSKNSLWEKVFYSDIAEENNLPQEPYSRPVNISSVEVFPPQDFESFQTRINNSGYLIPKNAGQPIRHYLENNWYLVAITVNATHLQMAASDSLTVYGGHSLPVKISFQTDKIIYPLKLASVEPDIDSQAVPLSFIYGTSSEKILGEKETEADNVLATPSANIYPSLPLNFSNLKLDLFVFSEKKTMIDGFTIGFADYIDNRVYRFGDKKDNFYFQLPQKRIFLTRLFTFSPLSLVEDLKIRQTNDLARVNPVISKKEILLRLLAIGLAVILSGYFIIRQIMSRIVRPGGGQARRSNK